MCTIHSELDLREQLTNMEEPDPIYDLFAVTVGILSAMLFLMISFCVTNVFITNYYNSGTVLDRSIESLGGR